MVGNTGPGCGEKQRVHLRGSTQEPDFTTQSDSREAAGT